MKKILCALFLSMTVWPAVAATTATVTVQPTFSLYQDGALVRPRVARPTFAECVDAGRLLNNGNGCQSRDGKFTRATVVDPPPPPPPVEPPPASSVGVFADLIAGPIGAPLTVCASAPIASVTIAGQPATVLATGASLNSRNDCWRVSLAAGVVSVNGAAGPTITNQPGDVLYVSLTGNDATAVKNDPAKPWRKLQGTADQTGALGAAKPGDVIVLRGGVWSDVAVDQTFARVWRANGTAPTGVKGSGYITITSYPGEVVTINAPKGGGIMGGGTAVVGTSARYFVISNLKIIGNASGASDGAPINLQAASDFWRVVNNDVSWPVSPSGMKAGGVVGHGNSAVILGNYVHDLVGGSENHGIYIDGADGQEIAYNLIENIRDGNLFQTYDAWSTTGITGLSIHDNLMRNGGRYGLNFSDQTVSLDAYRNEISNTALAGLRFSISADHSVNIKVRDSKFLGVNAKGSGSSSGGVNCDWNMSKGTAAVSGNTFTAGRAAAEPYDQYGSCPVLKFSGNTWSGFSSPGP